MCTSKCSGSCKNMLNHNDDDLKKSIGTIISTLDHLSVCSNDKNDPENISKNKIMTDINILKSEARLLLDEVNCQEGNSAKSQPAAGGYNTENIFLQYSLKERIKQLKQKIHLFEMAPAHDNSLTVLNPFTF